MGSKYDSKYLKKEVKNMVKNIDVEPLRDFTKYVVSSGFVENIPYPISGLIIAPPEHAKSSEVRKFECLGAVQVDKGTAWGLADIIKGMSKKELEIYHHFIILDLENYSSTGVDVKGQFLAFVRQTSQEGVKKYKTHKMDLDLEKRKAFGFLLCTTPDDLGDKRSVFRSLSFLSRFIPFTYTYSDVMKARILSYIEKEEHNIQETMMTKREEKETVVLPSKYATKLTPYAIMMSHRIEKVSQNSDKTVFGKQNPHELCGIRAKENLMAFCKSIALYRGRRVVIREDFDEFVRLYRWMNFKFLEIDSQEED